MALLLLALTWASMCVLPGNAQNDNIGVKVGVNIGNQPSAAAGGKSGRPALIDIDAAILISWCNHHHTRTCRRPGYPVTVTVTETKNHTITVSSTETTVTTVPTTTTETTVTTVPTTTTETTITTTTAPGETISITLPGSCSTDTVTQTATYAVSLCPSRTVNPTFTPTVPVPTDYIWGCPPGKLCIPNRNEADGDCNFEVGLPSPEFFCSPEECHDPPPLEPFQDDWDPDSSDKIIVSPHYYYLNPRLFGLDYDIFEFRNSTPEEPYPTSYPAQSPTQYPPQYPTQNPTQYTTAEYTTAGYPTGYATKYATKYSTLQRRQTGNTLPRACYFQCQASGLEAENSLLAAVICVENSAFKARLEACHRCIAIQANTKDPEKELREKAPNFVSILDICEAPPEPPTTPPSNDPSDTVSPTDVPSETTPPTETGAGTTPTATTDPPSEIPPVSNSPTQSSRGGDEMSPTESGPTGGSPSDSPPIDFPSSANSILIPSSKYFFSAAAMAAAAFTLL
ncbi:hypothetical protein RJZ90_000008 [Blastomyces dermatitidis]